MKYYYIFFTKLFSILSAFSFFIAYILSILRKYLLFTARINNTPNANGNIMMNPDLVVPDFTSEITIVLLGGVFFLLSAIGLIYKTYQNEMNSKRN